jgi:GTP1/Obg family GTP-binding protein
MADQRALAAIDRIERAIARIEAAAARPAAPADDSELQRVSAAHRALRGRVESAIAQIDRLLETAEAR